MTDTPAATSMPSASLASGSPAGRRRRRHGMLAHLVAAAVAAGVAAAVIGGGAAVLLKERNRTIAALGDQVVALTRQRDGLEVENTDLAGRLEGLLGEVRELSQRIEDSYRPVEVSRTVDFPVQRGMARPGDTVASFARREKTTVAVVQALNPWVKGGDEKLQDRQSLWIPKTGR